MWCAGVVIYIVLAGGYFPFGNRNAGVQNRRPSLKNRKTGSQNCEGFQSRETGTQKREAGFQNRVGPRDVRQFYMFEIMDDIMDDIKRDRSMFDLHCWSHVSEEAKVLQVRRPVQLSTFLVRRVGLLPYLALAYWP